MVMCPVRMASIAATTKGVTEVLIRKKKASMVKMFRSKPVREVGPALRLSGTAIRLNTSLVSTETTAEASESRPG